MCFICAGVYFKTVVEIVPEKSFFSFYVFAYYNYIFDQVIAYHRLLFRFKLVCLM